MGKKRANHSRVIARLILVKVALHSHVYVAFLRYRVLDSSVSVTPNAFQGNLIASWFLGNVFVSLTFNPPVILKTHYR